MIHHRCVLGHNPTGISKIEQLMTRNNPNTYKIKFLIEYNILVRDFAFTRRRVNLVRISIMEYPVYLKSEVWLCLLTSTSLKKKWVSAKLNIISSILYATWPKRTGSLRCFVANCPVNKEWNTTMVSSRSQMNIRSGPASVVSAEPILFPLPLWRLPRLQGFAVAPGTH